jgi:hypothetical protein
LRRTRGSPPIAGPFALCAGTIQARVRERKWGRIAESG